MPGTALATDVPELSWATPVEGQTSSAGISPAQIFVVLLAYWKQITILTLALLGCAYVYIKLMPKSYTATTTLLINLDSKDALAGNDYSAGMIGSYVATQIELMHGPVILRPVIDRLHLLQDMEFSGGFTGSGETLYDVVQTNLSGALGVERAGGGQMLRVSVASRDPAKAAQIANTVADAYIDQDRRRLDEPAAERAHRYTEQLAELREKVTAAQQKVTDYNRLHGVGDISLENAALDSQALNTLHQQLLGTQNQIRTLESKLTELNSGSDGSGGWTAKSQLDSQLAQLALLSNTYGPQHPKVQELNAQIALTRQSVANEKQSLAATTQADLAQARGLERKYLQAIADQEGKVQKIQGAQADSNKLLLELDSAKAVYKQALDGFDRIMFQAVADHSNVSVVNRAVAPTRPSKPKKKKLFLMAAAAAVGIGVGGPLCFGLLVSRRLRCRDDMERDFGIPVLAQLDAAPNLAARI